MIPTGLRPFAAGATALPPDEEVEALLHRVRSTLARLKYQIELMRSLDDREAALATIDELREMLRVPLVVPVAPADGPTTAAVLVIDDDQRLGRLIAAMARRHGFDADHVAEWPETLSPSTVAVVDWSVLRPQLVAGSISPNRRLVIISGRLPDLPLEPLGDPQVLLKPFDEGQLVAAVLHAAREDGAQSSNQPDH